MCIPLLYILFSSFIAGFVISLLEHAGFCWFGRRNEHDIMMAQVFTTRSKDWTNGWLDGSHKIRQKVLIRWTTMHGHRRSSRSQGYQGGSYNCTTNERNGVIIFTLMQRNRVAALPFILWHFACMLQPHRRMKRCKYISRRSFLLMVRCCPRVTFVRF